jgi:hypothetical protein
MEKLLQALRSEQAGSGPLFATGSAAGDIAAGMTWIAGMFALCAILHWGIPAVCWLTDRFIDRMMSRRQLAEQRAGKRRHMMWPPHK